MSDAQACQLALLRVFDNFCSQHGFEYWLAGGSLLGAVRHRGFIPWDDDIDVVMLRDDYDKLAAVMEEDAPTGTFWESAESPSHPTTIHLHGKFCELKTDFESVENRLFRFGIDVFALDWVPATAGKWLLQRYFGSFYKHLLPLLYGGSSRRFAGVKRLVAVLLRGFFGSPASVAAKYRQSVVCPVATKYLYSASGRYGYNREIFPASGFYGKAVALFEDMEVPIPIGAEQILLKVYGGDFMTVPTTHDGAHYRKKSATMSLVLATCGRRNEVRDFLESLGDGQGLQLIVADQNGDSSLDGILNEYSGKLAIEHIRLATRGVCKARNAVLSRVTCTIVGFPDDDCTYDVDTVSRVLQFFSEHPEADVLIGGDGRTGISRVNRFSLFRKAEMYLQFYRAETLKLVGAFDEGFGPGCATRYAFGGDDSDYLARAALAGCTIIRDTTVHVSHPAYNDGAAVPVEKITGYGETRMAVLKKLGYPLWFQWANVVYALAMLVIRSRQARYFAAMFVGRWRGLLQGMHCACESAGMKHVKTESCNRQIINGT